MPNRQNPRMTARIKNYSEFVGCLYILQIWLMHRVWNILKYLVSIFCFWCTSFCVLVDGVVLVCCKITLQYCPVLLSSTSCCLYPLCLNTSLISLALYCVGIGFDTHTVIMLYYLHYMWLCFAPLYSLLLTLLHSCCTCDMCYCIILIYCAAFH
jgi:hypothetical protein